MKLQNWAYNIPIAIWKYWIVIGWPGLLDDGLYGIRSVAIPWFRSRKFPAYFGIAEIK